MPKAEIVTKSQKNWDEKGDVTSNCGIFHDEVKTALGKRDNVYLRGFRIYHKNKQLKKTSRNIQKILTTKSPQTQHPCFKPQRFC